MHSNQRWFWNQTHPFGITSVRPGKIGAYALACGGVQHYRGPGRAVDLWRENGRYQIRSCFDARGRWAARVWLGASTLREAYALARIVGAMTPVEG